MTDPLSASLLTRGTDPSDAGPELNLVGDGSEAAERLRAASDRQRLAAADRIGAVLPGWLVDGSPEQVGSETLRVVRAAPELAAAVDLIALDQYLVTGDLSNGRGAIVDPGTGHAIPAEHVRAGPRPAPALPVVIGPFTGGAALDDGRTVVLNNFQARIGGPLEALCDDIATAFRSLVQANAYMSQGLAPGFGLHWDDHDVVILQVEGRKYWDVFAPAELGPIKGFSPEADRERSAWSGILEPGLAAYIPRGWSHEVRGVEGERSVHVTISNRRMTGLDVLVGMPSAAVAGSAEAVGVALEASVARWRAVIPVSPHHGPLGHGARRAAQFAGDELSVSMPGGIVFEPAGCSARSVRVWANASPADVPRELVGGLVHALERPWWTVASLASATGLSGDDALRLVDALGEAEIVRVRPDQPSDHG